MEPSDKKDEEYEIKSSDDKKTDKDYMSSIMDSLGSALGGNVPFGGGENQEESIPMSSPAMYKYELVNIYASANPKKGNETTIYVLNTETGNVICYTFKDGKAEKFSSTSSLKKEK